MRNIRAVQRKKIQRVCVIHKDINCACAEGKPLCTCADDTTLSHLILGHKRKELTIAFLAKSSIYYRLYNGLQA